MPDASGSVTDDTEPGAGTSDSPPHQSATDATEPPRNSPGSGPPGEGPEPGKQSAPKPSAGTGDGAEGPGQQPTDDQDGAEDAADEEREENRVLSPQELAASTRERSQMKRAGLDSLGAATLFGDRTSFGGAASFGGHAAMRDVNIFYGTRAPAAPPSGLLSPERLKRVRWEHVPGRTYEKAYALLIDEHLLVLLGVDGSGRRTTALHMLTGLAGDQVHGVEAEAVLSRSEELVLNEGYAYVAEISGLADGTRLAHTRLAWLSDELTRRQAHMILIAPHDIPIDAESAIRFAVHHEAPDCRAVLQRHIQRHPDHHREAERLLDTPELRGRFDRITSPRAAADIAQKLTEVASSGGIVEDVLAFLDGVHQERARQLLGTDKIIRPRLRVERLCRRALLVSLAVFTDMSYVDAATAAEDLACRFISVEFPRLIGREVFLGRRGSLLRDMDSHLTDSHTERRWGTAVTQRVAFRDPALAVAVISQVWQEYDGCRSSFLAWLRELAVRAPGQEVRVRAAQIIGMLAVREFGYLCDQVLFGWSRSINAQAREAAAIALETVAVTGKMHQQIGRLLTDWCVNGSFLRQQTAMLALPATMSKSAVPEMLANFRRLALRNNGKNSERMRDAVRGAVTELFLGPNWPVVILTLRDWADDPDPGARDLARRCAAPLIHFHDDVGRPSLLLAYANSAELAESVTAVLMSMLNEDVARRDVWDAFEAWVGAADRHPELTAALARLLADLRDGSAVVNDQLRFYLSLWASRHSG